MEPLIPTRVSTAAKTLSGEHRHSVTSTQKLDSTSSGLLPNSLRRVHKCVLDGSRGTQGIDRGALAYLRADEKTDSAPNQNSAVIASTSARGKSPPWVSINCLGSKVGKYLSFIQIMLLSINIAPNWRQGTSAWNCAPE